MSQGKAHVVDKMPVNFQQIGLLHLAFPNAPMIHIQRHPTDTCLSVYATQNRARIPWAHDKANIPLNYLRYLDLMEHWRNVLPVGRLLEIRYENLVTNLEPCTRQVLEFCGLNWSSGCLRPEMNERVVCTPSAWQVRRGARYRSTISPWADLNGLRRGWVTYASLLASARRMKKGSESALAPVFKSFRNTDSSAILWHGFRTTLISRMSNGGILEPLIPSRKRRGRLPKDSREILNALLYMLRTGCPWCALPHDFLPWNTVWARFRRRRNSGAFDRIYEELRNISRLAVGKAEGPTA